jgi:hypothetical protein
LDLLSEEEVRSLGSVQKVPSCGGEQFGKENKKLFVATNCVEFTSKAFKDHCKAKNI